MLNDGNVNNGRGATVYINLHADSLIGAVKDYYPGGSAYFNGQPQPASDLWFREGIVVPETSGLALLLAGAAVWGWVRRKRAQ